MSDAAAPTDPDRLDLVVFDRPVTVLLPPDPEAERRAQLRDAWSRCRSAARSGLQADPVVCDLRSSTSVLEGPAGGARLGDIVTTTVTTRTMESVLGEHLLLHAAGLSTADGQVMALCAPPGTGKTTATRMLGRSFGYVTDETVAVVPSTGQVLPYPKPLQIIDRSIGARKVAIGPDELGLREPGDLGALRLGPVIVLDRSLSPEDPEGPRIESLPLLEALPRIVAQTSSLHLLERPLQTLCSLMDAGGGPWVVRYAEAETLPGVLQEWLGQESTWSVGIEPWEDTLPDHVAPDSPAQRTPPRDSAPLETSDLVRRAPVHDAVAVDGRIGVLLGADFFLLQGIGATLWELLDTPHTLGELTAALVDVHGPVSEASAITAGLIGQLSDLGLLESFAVMGTSVR